MDAIQTIKEEVGRYLSGNDIYTSYEAQWTYLLESYMGSEEYKRGQHLHRYQLETNGEYAQRLHSAPYENHCQSIISVYNGFLFKTPPVRNLGSLENLQETRDFIKDADMDGRSFNNFMKEVATYSSIFGAVWVMVSKPNINAQTRGEELGAGIRPYVGMLSPLMVLDWQYARQLNGKYVLDYFKYIEDVNGTVTTVREWTPEAITTVVVDAESETIISRDVEPNGLGKIPAICAYNRRSMVRGIGISDIGDIADTARFIHNALSELDTSMKLDSHPSLAKTESTLAGNGPGSIIQMPDDLDPGLKPFVVQASGANIQAILATIEHAVDAIDKMANTGAVRARESRSMSGVAMEVEFGMLAARIAEKGDNMELVEEQIWRYFSEYQGVPYDCEIKYPDSYNVRDEHRDLELLIKASTTGITAPEFAKELQHQVVDIMVDNAARAAEIKQSIDDSMIVPHYMTNPSTGETEYVTSQEQHEYLLAEGYTE